MTQMNTIILKWPIEKLGLCIVRTTRIKRLSNNKNITIGELCEYSANDLYSYPLIGIETVREILDKLRFLNLALSETDNKRCDNALKPHINFNEEE